MTLAEPMILGKDLEFKAARQRLPERRPNQTVDLIHGNMSFAITFGYDPDTGEPREVFTHGAKVGSNMDAILDDACVLLSLVLQHGVKSSSLSKSMGYYGDSNEPCSIIGRLVNLLAEQEQENE